MFKPHPNKIHISRRLVIGGINTCALLITITESREVVNLPWVYIQATNYDQHDLSLSLSLESTPMTKKNHKGVEVTLGLGKTN